MQYTNISFPEIQLRIRDGHKLRGFFGDQFREVSPLLHNHTEDGTFRNEYPLIQYKVIGGVPQVIGLEAGSQLLIQLYTKIDKIQIEDRIIPVRTKELTCKTVEAGIADQAFIYRFANPYMGLNQKNYPKYRTGKPMERESLLQRILCNHLVGFLKAFNLDTSQPVKVHSNLRERSSQFKNNKMKVFTGSFSTNVLLPPAIGLGKGSARGFGAVLPIDTIGR
ncbi:CRISPR-associated endonuclease Cas6 [Pontibacter sp. G13]|uniref:CRISPR-associated endonuclease Cas6 n=1 Tax=Pontibacter sp. G13 TaxID=3074898 RepID=UPI0028891182|nr:CRISPR-associated endonuclease Cas6 [Pontibacter sp. G13]WNJ18154.1 CRISPR-associated endonuclease Cas6 [Pontibacter sp. G13]